MNWFLDRPWIIVVFIVAIIGLVGYAAYQEEMAWESFSAIHHCKPVAHTQGGSATTVLSNGKVGVTFIPPTTTFACDDGQNYTREN
jgi:hypothetical protein